MILQFEHNGKPITISPALGEWHIYIGDQRAGVLALNMNRPQEYILSACHGAQHLEMARYEVRGHVSGEQLRSCGELIADGSGINAKGKPPTIFAPHDDATETPYTHIRPEVQRHIERHIDIVDAPPAQAAPPPPRRVPHKKPKAPAPPMAPMQIEPPKQVTSDLWDIEHEGHAFRLLTNYEPNDQSASKYAGLASSHPNEVWMRDVAYDADGNVMQGWKSVYVRKDSNITIRDLL